MESTQTIEIHTQDLIGRFNTWIKVDLIGVTGVLGDECHGFQCCISAINDKDPESYPLIFDYLKGEDLENYFN